MNQVPDRKKVRQEYVWKKGSAYVRMVAGSLLLALVPCIIWICYLLALDCYRSNLSMPPGPMHGKTVAFDVEVLIVLLAVIIVVPFLLVSRGIVIMNQARQDVRISYVAENGGGLPAEEVLIRSSKQPPVAQSEALLRAATGQETTKEELLRVTASADDGGI